MTTDENLSESTACGFASGAKPQAAGPGAFWLLVSS